MIIAGIDGATNKTGISIFKDGKYIEHTLIDLHLMKNPDIRIPKMMKEICDYIGKYNVDKIIMEESMMTNNIDTVKKLSNVAGAVMYYATSNNIEFEFVLPSEWRKIIGLRQGRGIPKEILKSEAIMAVKQEYGMDLTNDEAEAILIARSGFKLSKIIIKDSVFTTQND